MDIEWLDISQEQLERNSNVVGILTAKGKYRYLTTGEIQMAKKIFKQAIDYSKVVIWKSLYIPVQGESFAMAPNGNIYFPPKIYSSDFSTYRNDYLFIHEMTHVWQYQLGYSPLINGAKIHVSCNKIWSCNAYDYVLEASKKLCDYNMEQQGNILANYYRLISSPPASKKDLEYYGVNKSNLHLYPVVLSEFLRDPSNVQNLPKV